VIFSDLLKGYPRQAGAKIFKGKLSVEQNHYMLGFSEPSVFRKAFKKMVGVHTARIQGEFVCSHETGV